MEINVTVKFFPYLGGQLWYVEGTMRKPPIFDVMVKMYFFGI